MGNGEEKRFLADNKSLIGLGLFVVLTYHDIVKLVTGGFKF